MAYLPVVSAEEIGLDAKRLNHAYQILEEWTSGPKPVVPGGAILVGRRGKSVAPRFFGRQGPEDGAPPIRKDGMFLLASITKPVTYFGAMILVERGLLNLTDKVTHYIPDFAAHHKEDTLVLHLFTHTSGMPDMLESNVELRKKHAPLSKFIEVAIRDTIPLFRPGTNYSYQSMGTLTVAEIIQRIAGMPIHDFLNKEIFKPLGMISSGLGSGGFPRERLVRVETPEYQRGGDYGWNDVYWQELGAPWGGMFSTVQDFAILCQLLLNGGEVNGVRLLAPGTVEMMTTNRFYDQPDLPEALCRSRGWGLGWRMNHPGAADSWSDLLDQSVFGHTGATGTMVWIDRKRQGFCLLFTTAMRSKAPWRLVRLSNAVAASFI